MRGSIVPYMEQKTPHVYVYDELKRATKIESALRVMRLRSNGDVKNDPSAKRNSS